MFNVFGIAVAFHPALFVLAVLVNCAGMYLMAHYRYRYQSSSRRLAYALDGCATLILAASVIGQEGVLQFLGMLAVATVVGTGLSLLIMRGLERLRLRLPMLNL